MTLKREAVFQGIRRKSKKKVKEIFITDFTINNIDLFKRIDPVICVNFCNCFHFRVKSCPWFCLLGKEFTIRLLGAIQSSRLRTVQIKIRLYGKCNLICDQHFPIRRCIFPKINSRIAKHRFPISGFRVSVQL